MRIKLTAAVFVALFSVACSSDDDNDPPVDGDSNIVNDDDGDTHSNPSACNGATATTGTAAAPLDPPSFDVDAAFSIDTVASINGPRELVTLPNGDLVVGTNSSGVYLVPNPEADTLLAPVRLTSIGDAPVAGVAFDASSCRLYIGARHGVYSIAYADGQTSADAGEPIALVRQENDNSHATTSVAITGGKLFIAVGSSCNACVETDPTRATIQVAELDGSGMTVRARRFRNPIALAVNPATGILWAGGAGQDDLPLGHPYEIFDAVTAHEGVADYGWPACEENHNDYGSGADCSATIAPRVALPPYSTPIGAVFYPQSQTGAHAFPSSHRGGAFVGLHGSWHQQPDETYYSEPRLIYVAMDGDTPATVDWSDPSTQWTELVGGFIAADRKSYYGRPTGVTVGREGSLFFADDQNGKIYRVRPK